MAEAYAILDETMEDNPVSRGPRLCKTCKKIGHVSSTCPDRYKQGRSLTELEFKDVHEKFHELGSSASIAQEMQLEIAEINKALDAKEYTAYLGRRTRLI